MLVTIPSQIIRNEVSLMATSYNVNQQIENVPFLGKWDLMGKGCDALNTEYQIYELIYNNHYNYLLNIMGCNFTWEGLPKTQNGEIYRSSFFEMMLATNGTVCIADTKNYGMVIAPCSVEGNLNFAGNPEKIILYPNYNQSMYSTQIHLEKDDKFVYCRNDIIGSATIGLIVQTANLLTTTYMSMITNISQQKFPLVIMGSNDQKLSTEILTNKIDAWEKYIVVSSDKYADENFAKVINKDVPYVSDKLYSNYMDILNNFFMRIGINTIPYAKKERYVADEVNANNQSTQASGDIYLQPRLEICEQYNQYFGEKHGKLSVRRNVDLYDSLMKPLENNTKGGDFIEQIHDRT